MKEILRVTLFVLSAVLLSFLVSVMSHEVFHVFQIKLRGGEVHSVCLLGFRYEDTGNFWNDRIILGWVASDTEVSELSAMAFQVMVFIFVLSVILYEHKW
jgi:hypothetical protein